MIKNIWKYNSNQNQEYLVKNFDNFIMTLISDEILLILGVYILFLRYLEVKVFCFIKVIKYNNFNFDCKAIKNKDGKKNGKKIVTN